MAVEEEVPGVHPVVVELWVDKAMLGPIVVRGVATGHLLRTGSEVF